MSYTREQLERWLKTIEVKGSVLDIGNAQNKLKGRTKGYNPEEYIGLDLEQPHQGECADIIYDINYPLEFK